MNECLRSLVYFFMASILKKLERLFSTQYMYCVYINVTCNTTLTCLKQGTCPYGRQRGTQAMSSTCRRWSLCTGHWLNVYIFTQPVLGPFNTNLCTVSRSGAGDLALWKVEGDAGHVWNRQEVLIHNSTTITDSYQIVFQVKIIPTHLKKLCLFLCKITHMII